MIFLPLFPLNLVAYPTEVVRLHIFEPRYKQLILECFGYNKPLGIALYANGKIGDYGTEMRLLDIVRRFPNGEMDIELQGSRVFKVENYETQVTDKLYPGGTVQILENIQDTDLELTERIAEKIKILYSALKINKKIEDYSVFSIGHHIGLTLEQEYALLQITHEKERQVFILNHLTKIVPVVVQIERLKERVRLNGHFKNLDILDLDL